MDLDPNRLTREQYVRSLGAAADVLTDRIRARSRRLDAAESAEILAPPGECVCYHGRGALRGTCTCLRIGWRRGDENGPRAFTEPCTPHERADADDETEPDVDDARRTCRIHARAHLENDEPVTDWDLTAFASNPAVLLNHGGADGDELPIGLAAIEGVDADGTIHAEVRFGTHERAAQVFELVKTGALRGISCGVTRLGKVGGRARLREISVVDVGRDPDSLVARRPKAGARVTNETTKEEDTMTVNTDAENDDATKRLERARKEHDERMASAWRAPPTPSANEIETPRTDAVHDPLDVEAARRRRDERVANAWRT